MSRRAWLALAAVPASFAIVFVAWPLAAVLARGFAPEGSLDLGAVGELLTSGRARSVVRFTFVQALLSMVLTLFVGLPAAWSASRSWWGARALRALVTAAFVMPTVVMALAFRSVFDRGLMAVVLAHVAFNVAVVVRVVGAAWAHLDPTEYEAASTLGAPPVRAWCTTTARHLVPSITASALLAFLFSFTSFGIVLLLGDYRQGTIETEIYRLSRSLQFDRAGVFALVQFAVVALVAVTYRRAGRDIAPAPVGARRGVRASSALAAALPALIVVTVPLIVLVDRTMRPRGTPSLAAWRALRSTQLPIDGTPLGTLRTSLVAALVATTVAVLIGGLASALLVRRSRGGRLLDSVLMLPLGVSAVTLGYGYLITFDEPPLRLRDHWFVIPLVHAAVAVPFVVRVLVPAIRAIDHSVFDAARTLGAGPWQIGRTVVAPLLAPAAAVAFGFSAAISLGEFGATSMLARTGRPTAPFAIGQLLGVPGDRPRLAAFALALVLAVVAAAITAGVDRFSPRALDR